MRKLVPIACVSLAGCQIWSAAYRSGEVAGASTTAYGGRVSVRSDNRVITGVVIAVMLAEGVRYYVRGDDGSITTLGYLPEPDPRRRVSEQDCTRPVDPTLGNLRCR
jgi:hypothetical protein